MTAMPSDDNNPFAPPEAVIGTRSEIDFDVDTEAELIRRHHLSHESSIKSLGLLFYVGAMLGFVFALAGALNATGVIKANQPLAGNSEEMTRVIMWLGTLFWGFVVALGFALGFGLRRLQVWARWTTLVFLVIAILYSLGVGLVILALFQMLNPAPVLGVLLFAIAIQGAIFYLLVAPKSGVVFSADYRRVIAQTPEIRSRTGLITKLSVGLLCFLIILGLIGVLASATRN